MLAYRRSGTTRSLLDGCLVEEIGWLLGRCLSRAVASWSDCVLAFRLLTQKVREDCQALRRRYVDAWWLRRVIGFFWDMSGPCPRRPFCYDNNAVAQDDVGLRYALTFCDPPLQLDLRERDYGEAFLSAWTRLSWRVYARVLQQEILRRPLTAFRVAEEKYLDARFLDAIWHQDVKQVIILHAGYGTRALRLEPIRRTSQHPLFGRNTATSSGVVQLATPDGRTVAGLRHESLLSTRHDRFNEIASSSQRTQTLVTTTADTRHQNTSCCRPSSTRALSTASHGVVVSDDARRHAAFLLDIATTARHRSVGGMFAGRSPTPRSSSSSRPTVRLPETHVRVIEVDAPLLQRHKAKLLLEAFPQAEVRRTCEGVVFAGCDLGAPDGLHSALSGTHCDPTLDTLVIAHRTFTVLPPDMVEHTLQTLRNIWLQGVSRVYSERTENEPKHLPRMETLFRSSEPAGCFDVAQRQLPLPSLPNGGTRGENVRASWETHDTSPTTADIPSREQSTRDRHGRQRGSQHGESDSPPDEQRHESLSPAMSPLQELGDRALEEQGILSEARAYPKWYLSFDVMSDTFVEGRGTLRDRTVAHALPHVLAGFPTDRYYLDLLLRSFGLRPRRVWNHEELMRTFCPGTHGWESWDCALIVDAEFCE